MLGTAVGAFMHLLESAQQPYEGGMAAIPVSHRGKLKPEVVQCRTPNLGVWGDTGLGCTPNSAPSWLCDFGNLRHLQKL